MMHHPVIRADFCAVRNSGERAFLTTLTCSTSRGSYTLSPSRYPPHDPKRLSYVLILRDDVGVVARLLGARRTRAPAGNVLRRREGGEPGEFSRDNTLGKERPRG